MTHAWHIVRCDITAWQTQHGCMVYDAWLHGTTHCKCMDCTVLGVLVLATCQCVHTLYDNPVLSIPLQCLWEIRINFNGYPEDLGFI